jgi:hypothetical protein
VNDLIDAILMLYISVNAARAVVAADGLAGLFLRGLGVRLLTNSLQSIMFSILWKLFLDMWVHSFTPTLSKNFDN